MKTKKKKRKWREVKTNLEETQEVIYISSDEQDAQRGILLTLPPLTPEVLNSDRESTMDFNGKVDGSSDWCGRGSRSRGSSTQ